MESSSLEALLQAVEQGRLPAKEALVMWKDSEETQSIEGHTNVDHGRLSRTGNHEIVYGESKSADTLVSIFTALYKEGKGAFASRVSEEKAEAVIRFVPARYNKVARTLRLPWQEEGPTVAGSIGVLAAGTSDIPVAKEALETLEYSGAKTESFFDIGVAGIQRLFSVLGDIQTCDVLVVCAGMEGALPSVVAGLVKAPVIAVPTSVGYGVSQGGVAALLTMLATCSPGVVTVNIDNGVGAALSAVRMLLAKQGASSNHTEAA